MCELLEKAREAQGNISYYEVAKRLGISTPLMNKWKNNKSKPNGIHSLELADMAGVSPKKAIELMKNGYAEISIMIAIAMVSMSTLMLTQLGASLSQTLAAITSYCILC